MPSDRPKAWERGRANGRITAVRNRRRVLILCEDAKSARLYFEGFQMDRRRVEVLAIGTGMNTDSLVEEAIHRKQEAVRRGRLISCFWRTAGLGLFFRASNLAGIG